MSEDLPCFRCGGRFESPTERAMHVIRKRCPEIETERDVDAADQMHEMDLVAREFLGEDRAEELFEEHYDVAENA